MNNVKNEKGFSMVEVLVVMSIIMVLSAVAGLSVSIVNNANVSKAAKKLDSMFNEARITAMAKGEAKGTLSLKVVNGTMYGYIGATPPANIKDWDQISGSAVKAGRENKPTSFNVETSNVLMANIAEGSLQTLTFTPSGAVKVPGGAAYTTTNVYTFSHGKRACMFYFYPETGQHGTRIFNLP